MPADIYALQAANSRTQQASPVASNPVQNSQLSFSQPSQSQSPQDFGNESFGTRVGNFFKGAANDIGSIASGFGTLFNNNPITNPVGAISDPKGMFNRNVDFVKALPSVIGTQLGNFGKLAGDTLQGNFSTLGSALENHPLDSLLNALIPLGLAKQGLGLSAKAAEAAGAAEQASKLASTAGRVGKVGEFIDPINLITKGGGKALDVAESIPKIGTKIANIRDTVQNAFSNSANVAPEVNAARQAYLGQANLDPALVREFADDVVKKFPNLTEEEGLNVSKSLLNNENPGSFGGAGGVQPSLGFDTAASGLTAREIAAHNFFKNYFENSLKQVGDAGVQVGSRENYLPLRYEENYAPKQGGSYVADKINSFLESNPQYRKISGQGFEKQTQLPRQVQQRLMTDPEFANKLGLHPITDPRRLAVIYEGEKRAALGQQAFVNALKERPNVKGITTTEVQNIPGLEGKKFTVREADVVSKTIQAFRDPSEWGKVMHAIFDIPNEYAKFGLFSSPVSATFHISNISTLAHLAGFSPFNPLTWAKVPELLKSITSQDELFQSALKNRAIAGNFAVSKPTQLASDVFKEILDKESSKTVKQKFLDFMKNQIPTPGNIQGGKTIGQQILWKYDETMRLGYYQKLLEKGIPETQAGKMVRDAFVKYDDMTPFEQQVMRRVFFFYPWLKGSLPAVIRSFTQNPVANKELQLAGQTQSPEAQRRGEIEVNGVAASPSTPLKTAQDLVTNPGGLLYSRTNPVIRSAVTSGAGQAANTKTPGLLPDFFPVGYKPQPIAPGVSANPRIANVINNFVPGPVQLSKVMGKPNPNQSKKTADQQRTATILSNSGFFPSSKTIEQQQASDQRSQNISNKNTMTENRKSARSTAGFGKTSVPGVYFNP